METKIKKIPPRKQDKVKPQKPAKQPKPQESKPSVTWIKRISKVFNDGFDGLFGEIYDEMGNEKK